MKNMKKIIKKILPGWAKQIIQLSIKIPELLLSPVLSSTKFTASIYYAFFSCEFNREHKAVLSGKVEYNKKLKDIGDTSVLLRRNIHRIEKGLIMQPRRDVFAENFIGATVDIYEVAMKTGHLNVEEKKWITDVLEEYFSVVKDTRVISRARVKFGRCSKKDSGRKKYVPYPHHELPQLDISYEQLQRLVNKRRSVRWYKDRNVPLKLIEKAVTLAAQAPSACNRQPFFFYVADSKKMAVKIAKCAGGTPGWADGIPCMIVIVGDLSSYPSEKDRHLIYIDASLAAMQLMLAFETLGLSTCAINWPDVEAAERKIEKLLDLKSYERPVMLLSVGYPEANGGIPYSQKKDANVLIKKVQND